MKKLFILLCAISALYCRFESLYGILDEKVQEQQEEKKRIQTQIDNQRLEDQRQESRRIENQEAQRRLDNARWDRQHGR